MLQFSKSVVIGICLWAATAACYPSDPPLVSSRQFEYSPSVTVSYDVQGTGEVPVVMLHSLAGAKESWDALMPGLLEVCNCRAYRLDLKGHGDTSAPDDREYSMRENTAMVRAFMAHQQLRHAILIGHSYGGAVALNLALDAKAEDPGLLRALILIATPGVLQRFPFIVSHHRYEGYGKVVDHITTPSIRAWIAVHAGNYTSSSGTRNRVKLYARLWKDPARSRAARRTARQFVDGGGLKELASRDHDTGVPTLLIAGTRDHLVGVKRMRKLATTIPGSTVSVIRRAGHAPQEDVPEAVVPVISKFLNSVPAVRDTAPEPE